MLRILSTLGLHGVLQAVLPRLEPVETVFDPTQRLLARIAAGERGDVAILTAAAVERLTAEGVLAPGTRRDLAVSIVGLAVPAGAPRPPIGTVEELRATLLAAPSLCYSRAGASGIFFARLIERLGIAAEVNAKATVIPEGFTAALAARGEVALAVQQVSELLAVPGVDLLGPLPDAIQERLVFAGACFAGAAPGARALLDAIAAAATPALLRAKGLEPA